MRCGEQCFVVKFEVHGEQKTAQINARTPVEARKKLRVMVGAEANIISVNRQLFVVRT